MDNKRCTHICSHTGFFFIDALTNLRFYVLSTKPWVAEVSQRLLSEDSAITPLLVSHPKYIRIETVKVCKVVVLVVPPGYNGWLVELVPSFF